MKNIISRQTDWFLVCLIVVLFAIGLVALYSAGGEQRMMTQMSRGVFGVILMLGLSRLPLLWLRNTFMITLVCVLLMLVLVLIIGVKINNTRRWLNLGFYLQPSEFMRVLLPVGLAYGYTLLPRIVWWHHLVALMIVFVPVVLVLKQPDFGTAAMIGVAGFATVFFAGISWRWLVVFFISGLGVLPLIWRFVLKPYQQKRVLTMFDPYQDPLGAGYHTIQSQIAVGSGGIWGKGFQLGTQAQLGFLPERHTDFIFAVYAEEFGLVGAVVLLGVGVLITWRCFYIAGVSVSRFGAYAVAGLAASFFITLSVNLCMVSGLLPVVGMPLPLVSYGGSALLATFIGFGFILAIAAAGKEKRR